MHGLPVSSRMFHRRPLAVAIAGSLTFGLAGCGTLSPYQHMSLNGPRIVATPAGAVPGAGAVVGATSGQSAAPSGGAGQAALAGDMAQAWTDVEAQRQAFFDKLDASAMRRSLGASALYGLVGWAAFNGMKPEPTSADALRSLRLSVTGSTLYLATDHALNHEQEAVHARGYQALSCLMLQSSPLRWPQGSQPAADAAESTAAADNASRPPAVGSRADLAAALTRLEWDLNASWAAHQAFTQMHRAEDFAPNVRSAIQERSKALDLARIALREGRQLLQRIDDSGPSLRHRAAMIIAATNAELQTHQRALPGGDLLATQMRGNVDSLMKLGQQTEAEETKSTSGGAKLAGSANTISGSGVAPGAGEGDGTGAGPGKAAGTATAGAATGAAASPATQADLQALRDELARLIVDPKAKQQAETAQAASTAQQKQLEARIAELQKINQHQAAVLARCEATAGPTCRTGDDLTAYLHATNALHARRRPVALALTTLRQSLREVAAFDGCQGGPQMLSIHPAEAASVKAPATLEFAITAVSGGVPRVGLNGLQGGALVQEVLAVRASDGVLTARISLPAGTPAGELTLWATDSQGRHGQQVKITVAD